MRLGTDVLSPRLPRLISLQLCMKTDLHININLLHGDMLLVISIFLNAHAASIIHNTDYKVHDMSTDWTPGLAHILLSTCSPGVK